MRSEYNVIVVGAGPAGASCALTLARKGVAVLMIDKSGESAKKRMGGGIVYGKSARGYGLLDLVPEFELSAPLERKITSHEAIVLSEPDKQNGRFGYYRFSRSSLLSRLGLFSVEFETGHDYSVIRASVDDWLARMAVEAGASFESETMVTGLLKVDGAVQGVVTTKGKLRARVVVDCSGVTSPLVESAGLRGPLAPRQLYHGIKRVYKLDPRRIEERLGLKAGEGKALYYIGDFMLGIGGNGFVYPTNETLSVGIIASMDTMIRATTEHFDRVGKLQDALEAFENHPIIEQVLEGAELVDYSAQNIPKGFKCILKKPYSDGFLVAGDALGAFVKIGPMIDGTRNAIASGIMAAETYLAAVVSGSFREKNLSRYRDLLTPIYEDVNRSGRDSFISESGLVYRALPRILLLRKRFAGRAQSDRGERISASAGSERYDEIESRVPVRVDVELASRSLTKPWIPACPVDCFTLRTPKGTFASFKDLYQQNLALLGSEKRGEAVTQTLKDVSEGKLGFDHLRCVGCGTCGAIGPKEMVSFGLEEGRQVV